MHLQKYNYKHMFLDQTLYFYLEMLMLQLMLHLQEVV